MNGIGAKIILSFFGLVFFVILVLFSFFSSNNNVIKTTGFSDSKIGEYKYNFSGSGKYEKEPIIFKDLDKGTQGDLLEKNIGIFTNIYSNNPNYKVSKKGKKIELTIGTGAYLLDSKNPFQEIVINVGKYKVELKNGGMLYLENTGTKGFIISLNNISKVTFEKGVEMYLYPHMYFGFITSRFSEEASMDSLRLSQLAYSLGYFQEHFGNLSEGVLGRFIKNEQFFKNTLSIVSDKQKSYKASLEVYKTDNIDSVSGIKYIEKYFSVFYNKKKKLVYYQNRIIKESIELLKTTNIDPKKANTITKTLLLIQKLDKKTYKDTLKFIDNLSYIVFNDLENTILIKNYSQLIQKINGFKSSTPIDLMKDFDRLNFRGKKVFYNNLLAGYKVEGDIIKQEYYSYFIRNVIFEGFQDSQLSESNFNILIDIFNQYASSLNIGTYKNQGEDITRQITNIVYNEKILQSLNTVLLKEYFGDRNSQGLLQRTSKKITNLKGLENAINNIELYYKDGKVSLDINGSKNAHIIKSYKTLKTKFEEYLFALKNYALYKKKYSNIGIAIDEVEVYSSDTDDGLSKEKFIKYMENFNSIDLNSIELNIEEDGYMVNSIGIKGNTFSFFMNPFRGNRIIDIIIKNSDFEKNTREYIFYKQLGNITYEMEEEKEKYKKMFEKAKDKDRERFDFKNFFKNTFFPAELLDKLTCEQDINCKGRDFNAEDEDEGIRLLKTAKLLGQKGEFKSVKNILQVKYSNLFVTKEKDSNFNISIQNSTLQARVMKNKKLELVFSEFESNYALEGGHYFYNIILKPYEKSTVGDKEYIFGDTRLYIKGKVSIADFESKMKKILEQIDDIKIKYKDYKRKNTEKISQINYFPNSQRVTFK